MERERIRSRAGLAVERSPERMGGDVTPLMAPSRDRREAPAHWSGLEDFLAVLPRVFATHTRRRATGRREIANDRSRSTFGNDAA